MSQHSIPFASYDPFTRFQTIVQSDHRYIHEGLGYIAIYVGAISSTTYLGFKTPTYASKKYIHWRPTFVSSSEENLQFYLYEENAYTGGADIIPVNLNRNSLNTTNMQEFKSGVTATPTGTIIQAGQIGVEGNPNARSGGGGGANEEIVLMPDLSYVLQLVPSGSTTVIAQLFWYEEGNG